MKLTKKVLEKDASGFVSLIPEEPEDMWHAYNLLQKGDHLKATTVRRVVSESATGSTEKSSHKISLTISVESVFFDTQAAVLRVNGRNIVENKFVKLGAYHTLDLELHRQFSVTKELWDLIALERIDAACDIAKRADIAAVVIQEGVANICLVTEHMTVVRQKVEMSIPKKRRGTSTDHDKGLNRFYDQIVQGVIRHIDFSVVKVLLVGSPGFYKDGLYKFMMGNSQTNPDYAVRSENKSIMENKSKIVLVHCSSGHKQALTEALSEPGIQAQLVNTKYAGELNALNDFYRVLGNDPAKAFYGYEYVIKAAEQGAISTLMVTDGLFRSAEPAERQKYIALVELVRSYGGKSHIFSSLHTTGEQLTQLTGIAAILSFPMADLEEQVELEETARRNASLGVLAPRADDELVESDQDIEM